MNKKGFSPITIVLLVVAGIVVLSVGAYYIFKAPANIPVAQQPAPTSTTPVVITPTSTAISTPISTASSTPTSTQAFILRPTSGPVGTVVTIYGTGFAATGNMITINGMVSGSLKDLYSNGSAISFAMPSSLGPNCKPDQACPQYLVEVTNNAYTVAVISPTGVTKIIGTFTVTGKIDL